MEGKDMAKVGVLCAALGGAAFFAFRNAKTLGEDTDFTTRRIQYLCGDPACATGFDAPMKDVRESAQSGGVACPKCGKQLAVHAFKCAGCGKMNLPVGHGQVPSKCEYCKKKMVVDDPNERKK